MTPTRTVRVLRLALAAALAWLPTAARAQAPSGDGPATVLQRLEAGQRLRVELAERRHEGRLVGFHADSVVIGSGAAGAYVTVPVGELGRLWTRGNSAGTGALVGGGAGLLVGGLFGAWLGTFACSETSEDCALEGALAVGGLGLAGGAGVGALVGLVIPRWVQRWP